MICKNLELKNIQYYLILFFLILFISCKKEYDLVACDTQDPLVNISWLKDVKDGFDSWTSVKGNITYFEYYGNDVFMITFCVGCPDAYTVVYDCEMNVICEFGGIAGLNTCTDFHENAENKIILYDK